MGDKYVNCMALMDKSQEYRYVLMRQWNEVAPSQLQACAFIGLNPSTADHRIDDPTIRRCVGFARGWGFDALYMLNVFAFRATNPMELTTTLDPVGPDNYSHIKTIVQMPCVTRIVLCWGTTQVDRKHQELVLDAIKDGPEPVCFGRTKWGSPRHPLYMKKDAEPVAF